MDYLPKPDPYAEVAAFPMQLSPKARRRSSDSIDQSCRFLRDRRMDRVATAQLFGSQSGAD
jgi:hypothetical protein